MDKKEQLSVNPSSGAEKVENIEKDLMAEKQAFEKGKTKKSLKEPKKSAKKEQSAKKKVEAEKKRAKSRVERAKKQKLSKQERKAKAEEKRKLIKAKREEKRAKIAAARRARALREKELLEKRKALRAEKAKSRQEKKAARKAKRAEDAAARKKKTTAKKKRPERQKKNHQHQRAAGFGGWLAAVIALGVVTLTLASIVTVGAVDMSKTNRSVMMNCKGNLCELAGVMDNVDDDLDKARVAASSSQQSEILTDLLLQTRLAEATLEKLPIEGEADRNLTTFLNCAAKFAEETLAKLRLGERLNERDEAVLARLYETSHKVRQQLDKTIAELTDCDMMDFIKEKKDCKLKESIKSIEDITMPENKPAPLTEASAPVGDYSTQKKPAPALSREQAEALCKRYFKGYEIEKTEYLGETTSAIKTYDFRLTDSRQRELYVQIDKNSGALVEFDFYEDCKEKKYDLAACEDTAIAFLNRLGYENMIAVYGKESGATVDYVFVYQTGGVTYYPDEVKVKVCMEKGVVIGLEASKFLRNHHSREAFSWDLSMQSARAKLHSGVNVLSEQKVVIDSHRKERAAYEFFVEYQKDRYLIYTDAQSGEEITVVNVKNLIV